MVYVPEVYSEYDSNFDHTFISNFNHFLRKLFHTSRTAIYNIQAVILDNNIR